MVGKRIDDILRASGLKGQEEIWLREEKINELDFMAIDTGAGDQFGMPVFKMQYKSRYGTFTIPQGIEHIRIEGSSVRMVPQLSGWTAVWAKDMGEMLLTITEDNEAIIRC